MILTIERVPNGYIFRNDEEVWVIEEDTAQENIAAELALRMLWEVNEIIGHIGSRYDGERISISLVPGDKHDDLVELGLSS